MRTLRTSAAAAAALLLTASTMLAAAPAARLAHTPPPVAAAGEALPVSATIVGGTLDVATADVIVLTPAGERALPLSLSENVLRGAVPPDLVRPPELRYYLRVEDVDGGVLTAPAGSPEAGWYVVGVAEPAVSVDPGIVVVVPLPGEVVPTRAPEIAAIFDPPLEDPWMAVLLLDGRDVTAAADVRADHFYLPPGDSLAPGAHTVTVSALTPSRNVEGTWTFFVQTAAPPGPAQAARLPGDRAPADERGVVLSGTVEVGWAVVEAETTAVESLDVFLPYEECSAPSFDLYASAVGPSSTWVGTARYDPLYDDRLNGSLLFESRSLDLEAGDIFPSLTRATLDWAAGLGARAVVRAGPARTDAVAMRLAEADTAGGLGIYARYALGAMETVEWGAGDAVAVAFVHAFDDTASVSEEDRLIDPTDNDVLAVLFSLSGEGGGLLEAEAARSWSEGDADGDGGHLRVRAGYERDHANRVSVEYSRSDTLFYSVGSIATEPGQEGVAVEAAWGPSDAVRFLATAEAHRTSGTASGVDPDAWGSNLYGRVDVSFDAAGGEARGYALARHDRTPYEEYDYSFLQGAAGCSYRRGGVFASASLSWSRASSDGEEDTIGAGGDARWEVVPRRLTVRASTRWTVGDGDDADYTRATHTLGVLYRLGACDIDGEYRYVERDDRVNPDDGYTEHVGLLSLGRRF